MRTMTKMRKILTRYYLLNSTVLHLQGVMSVSAKHLHLGCHVQHEALFCWFSVAALMCASSSVTLSRASALHSVPKQLLLESGWYVRLLDPE